MKKIAALFLLFACIVTFTSCRKDLTHSENGLENSVANNMKNGTVTEKTNTFYGPQVHVGNGKVRSWMTIGHDDQPVELGVEFTAGALEELPDHGEGEAHPYWNIPFHQKVKDVTPFDHLTVNWNPEGHIPFFFQAPHFDIHFYMITEAERLAIPAWSPSTNALFNNYPPAGYMPASYSTPPGAVGAEAAMGKHWLPPPPSFLPFRHVMILGTYNGIFNFIEPMVTLAFMQSGQPVSTAYAQPQKFAKAGNYPTKYNVWKDENTGSLYISLSDFVWRNAN